MTALLLSLLLGAGARAQAPAPKLAVVIDDFGLTYKKDVPDEDWYALKFPMAFAVMPVSPRTKEAAKRTKESGHELLIHFPFDKYLSLKLPSDRVDPQDLAKVKELLAKAFAQIPGPKGLNNHQSLRGTANRPMMAAFMPLLKGHVEFFLDSRVGPHTVAYQEARKAGLPAAINDIFLDGGHEPKARRKGGAALAAAIAKDKAVCLHYLGVVAAQARRRGEAVAIGHHYYHGTYECLVEGLPKLQKEGFQLVYVSQLAR